MQRYLLASPIKIITALALLISPMSAFSGPGMMGRFWNKTLTWDLKKGSVNAVGGTGTFGTKGTADSSVIPPGAYGSGHVWDKNNKLWIFFGATGTGGAATNYYNYIMRYNPLTNNYTWMSGTSTAGSGGTYGTMGTPSVNNVPSSRGAPAIWYDGDNTVWLFGGGGTRDTGVGVGDLSDLWKFDISTLEWTWVGGPKTFNDLGVYGTKGVEAAGNWPGARYSAGTWIDGSGNLWMFGGQGFPSSGVTDGKLNDLWKYNVSNGQWTWVSGSDQKNQNGTYGTKGTPSTSNIPGGRYGPVMGKDSSGLIWLFGGGGYAVSGGDTEVSDVWRYNTATNEWTWMAGPNTNSDAGTYGTKGVPSTSNSPTGGGYSGGMDAGNNLYIFGGAYTVLGVVYRGNRVWRFNTSTLEWTWLHGPAKSGQANENITGTDPTGAGLRMSVTTIPGSRNVGGVTAYSKLHHGFWFQGGYGKAGSSAAGDINQLYFLKIP